MVVDNVEDILYLSPMQHLMLMHSLRLHGSSTLVNQFSYEIRGPLDVERFRQAWQWATERHQALRTGFVWEEVPQPVQVVRDSVDVAFAHIDVSQQTAPAQQSRIERIRNSDRDKGFDLRLAPLMRMTLVTLDSNRHLLIWTRHHLILDLWSQELLFREVLSGYEQGRPGTDAGQFGDYVAWIGEQDPLQAEAYWRGYLKGLTTPSLLFSERPHRSEWSKHGQSVHRKTLGPGLVQRLTHRAGEHRVTANTLFQVAVALSVALRCARSDLLFGLTVAGRPTDLPDIENTLGSFINNVPARFKLDPEQLVRELLLDIQSAQVKRMAYDYFSPVDIQRCSELPADKPLFDLLLLLNLRQSSGDAAGSLEIGPASGPLDSALPLTLMVDRRAQDIELTAVYDGMSISGETAVDFIDDVIRYLERLIADGDARLSQLLPAPVFATRTDTDHSLNASTGDPTRPTTLEENPQDILLDIWRRTLGIADIGIDEDFFALGGTSIQAAIAFAEIEQRLGVSMPLATLFSAGSVRGMLAAVEAPASPPSVLINIQRNGVRPALIAAFGVGGNVINLAALSRALGDTQPFYGLQSRGLDGCDAPLTQVEEIASDYLAETGSLTQQPCVLLGVCFGANVMLEMAHQLSRSGRPPALLVVMDPTLGDSAGSAEPELLDKYPTLQLARDRLLLYKATLRSMGWRERAGWVSEKFGALVDKLRHRDLLHGNETELVNRRVERANLAAANAYRPAPYDGEVRVLITADRELGGAPDPRHAWAAAVAPQATIVLIPGNDTGQAVGQYAPVLAEHLSRWIDEIEAQ